ncbi:Tubulin-folding cofactor B [Schistosoma japonicum]|uniref:Tubulin-folding cofactor B n=1 Tax=Schistosoma japonicum TaxID=6182 RepID=A0A4Z2DAF3_SCHJA|nr:Tubulin-folding cofactor B [Schistosoma japonicum]KAH8855406.1 Tubulin-folding cofactor B [Schistosoma japonicum]KAH8855407.1 Tubulin-folding cofactor B [Schistosoma japonicum]KAH8855408.1 Tubulin-folding cofactor B [Schistosoma japonicum]KAH8855409.1 Tubulin-folding cofactor B [Schistosoma japonicum]
MSNFVNLIITTNASKLRSKKRFPLDINVGQLKEKLVLVTGCDNRTMKIELFDKDDKSLGQLVGDDKPLWDFGVEDGMHIHITDLTTQDGAYDQTEEPAETFQLSTEEYAKRKDSVLAWKRQNKIGQFRDINSEEIKQVEEQRQLAESYEKQKAELLPLGSRCEVRVPGQPTKRGVIEFIGQTKFKPGYWVGVRYDEPLGRNDGSIDGVRYFECPEKYGAFVKPQYVEAGDFPEFGIDDLDEI